MRKTLACVIAFITINTISIAAGSWTPGTFEIHRLNIANAGVSQLIISPIGKTLLINCPENNWDSSECAEMVAGKIEKITGSKHIDYILTSSLSLAHIGYAGKGGIWALLNKYGITCDRLVDRDAGFWHDFNLNGLYDKGEIIWKNAGETNKVGEKWLEWVTNPNSDIYHNRVIARLDSSNQIQLGGGVKATVLQTDALGAMMNDGKTPLSADHTDRELLPSESNYSIALWIQFGDFDYILKEGINNLDEDNSLGYIYNGIESIAASKVNRKIEVMSANFHDLNQTKKQIYKNILKPQVVLYSTGHNLAGYRVASAIETFNNTGSIQYFSGEYNLVSPNNSIIRVNGDIVIKSTDGKKYTVNEKLYTCHPATNEKIVLIGTESSQTDDVGIATITYSGGVTIVINKESDSSGIITVKGSGIAKIYDLSYGVKVINEGNSVVDFVSDTNPILLNSNYNDIINANEEQFQNVELISNEIINGTKKSSTTNSAGESRTDNKRKLSTAKITGKSIELQNATTEADLIKGTVTAVRKTIDKSAQELGRQ